MVKKTIMPVLAFAALGLAFSFNGCSCHESMSVGAKAPDPAPPPPPPPVVAAPEPPPPAPAPIKTVGKATIENGQIKIPGKLEFDVNKASIRNDPSSTEILSTLTELLKQNPHVTKIRVEGHTDNSGAPEHNKQLSKERAEAVAKYLSDHGIDKSRVDPVGWGQEHTLVPNDTAEHKQINRRTEFHITELDGKAVDPSKVSPADPTLAAPPAAANVAPPPAGTANAKAAK